MIRRPVCSSLFPSTTLFRSRPVGLGGDADGRPAGRPGNPRSGAARGWRGDLRTAQGDPARSAGADLVRSEEHTSELQSHSDIVCRLPLEKKKRYINMIARYN